eukprot:jgi/Hompol1/4986/HPOL_004071-RA
MDDDALADHDYVTSNASSIIQKMFRYNPNRYMDDDSDSDMEVGYSAVEKEEKRSARIARKEEEEEDRLERERLERKRLRK